MRPVKRQQTPPKLLQEWSTAIQFLFAESLPLVTSWTCRDAVFHGGTSLNMSWGSPRYSEDLDFLINQDRVIDLPGIMAKALRRMQAAVMLSHPGLVLEMKDKTKEGSRLQHFQILASHPAYFEKTMVKVEFWKVDDEYLKNYSAEFVFPARHGDIVTRSTSPLPAATLESAYADKLTAFATRPFLKWRDIFDLWWIDRQVKPDMETIANRFLHHVKGYQTVDGLAPGKALRAFLDREPLDSVIEKADPDLRKWLPEPIWQSLWPEGVRQMTELVFSRLDEIATLLGAPADQDEAQATQRARPRP